MMWSMIFVWVVMGWRGMFQFINDLEDACRWSAGIVNQEAQLRRVFENDRMADQALDALAVVVQQGQPFFLLLVVAQDAQVNRRQVQVAADRRHR